MGYYDCSQNTLTDRAAARGAEQADYRRRAERLAAFERRLAALENRVAELETWQACEQEERDESKPVD